MRKREDVIFVTKTIEITTANMKILFYTIPAALCVALTVPAQGQKGELRGAQEPDTTVVVDEAYEYADTVAYEDWDEAPDDNVGTDEGWANDSIDDEEVYEPICPPDDELLADFNAKEASFNFQNKENANTGITFTATIFTPGDTKKQSGFNVMVSQVLQSILPEDAQPQWKTDALDKMLENKWKIVKEAYINEMKHFSDANEPSDDAENAACLPSYSYNTSVMPAWRFDAGGGLVTYKVDDEVYLGGAHGMPYCYYLTLSEKTDALVGLTDIFKEESLGAVFALVGEKLASRPDALTTEDEVWQPVAELGEQSPTSPLVIAHAVESYGGKLYPRPAVTPCGILFSYAPYEKDCYAAGTVEIMLPYEEIGQYLIFRP